MCASAPRCESKPMSHAPEPFHSACLEVIFYAVLDARVLAWGNFRLRQRLSKKRQEQIADLMDMIHNIPRLMNDWERCDQAWLRASLEAYDSQWKDSPRKFARLYDDCLRKFAESKQ